MKSLTSNVTREKVRNALNIPANDVNQLKDEVIDQAIDSATTRASAHNRRNITGTVLDEAILAGACYFAYRAISDYLRQELVGEYSAEDGSFQPEGEVKVRELEAKLRMLRLDWQEMTDILEGEEGESEGSANVIRKAPPVMRALRFH